MKPEPDPAVRSWLDEQAAETLYLSSVTVAELMFGIGALALGKRKDKLTAAVNGLLELFEDRILPFDTRAARCYANLAIKARAAGRGLPTPDGYIAAIAASRDFAVASRGASAFAAADLPVIDPWVPAT
jgi:predicted nucleic acid-binding protein